MGNNEEELENGEIDDLDLGGSEPPKPVKDLNVISDSHNTLFQDKDGYIYVLGGGKLIKLGIQHSLI